MDFYVPYEEKEDAKDMGAQFDWNRKVWYAPNNEIAKQMETKWKPIKPALDELVGEDITYQGNELFIDMIPTSSWGENARRYVDPSDWHRVKTFVSKRANYKCEYCGDAGSDTHEKWEYNDDDETQILKRLTFLCKICHLATHTGYASICGRYEEAIEHLKDIRKWTDDDVGQHSKEQFKLHMKRSRIQWTLDLSILENSGIELVEQELPYYLRE